VFDFDNDDIPDECDDCPTAANSVPCDALGSSGNAKCALAAVVYHGDGIPGPQPTCVLTPRAAAIGKPGVCSNQHDYDNDGRGDACDNCVTVPNWHYQGGPGDEGNPLGVSVGVGPYDAKGPLFTEDQRDSYGAGVGDACNYCTPYLKNAGVTVQSTPCVTDSDCKTGRCAGAGAAGQPLPYSAGVYGMYDAGHGKYVGACESLVDTDGDGVPDGCDNCVDMRNHAQSNCNAGMDAKWLPFPYRGDACDPVPCTVVAHGAKFKGDPIVDPETYMNLLFTPNVLVNKYAIKAQEPHVVSATVRLCEGTSASCPLTTAGLKNPAWRNLTLVPDNTPGGPSVHVEDSSIGFQTPVDPAAPEATSLGYASMFFAGDTSQQVTWQISADLQGKNLINGQLWTHVTDVGWGTKSVSLTSVDDPATAQKLADLSNSYAGIYSVVIGDSSQPGFIDTCKLSTKGTKVCPILVLPDGNGPAGSGNCANDVFGCPWWGVSGGLLALAPDGGALAGGGGGKVRDISSLISPDLNALLHEPTTVWVSPSEPEALQPVGAALFVGLSPTGSLVAAGSIERGRLVPANGARRPEPDGPGRQLSVVTSAQVAPLPLSGFGAAYAASLDRAYVVGGLDAQGRPASAIQMIDTREGTSWTIPIEEGPLPGVVLAALYRTVDRTIYVVDDDGVHGKLRLLRVDPSGHRSTLLGSWKKAQSIYAVFLSNLGDGSVVLVASSSKQAKYVAGIVRFGDDKHVRLRRVVKGKGSVVLAPRTTAAGLNLAVFKAKEGVRPAFVPVSSFYPSSHDQDGDDEDCDEVFH
jgi:hypothetical protein